MFAGLVAFLIACLSWLITAAQGFWHPESKGLRQAIFFANHTSNGDTVILWSVLPRQLRKSTRPVAAADYWLTDPIRSYVGRKVFNCVLIQRDPALRTQDPVAQMTEALAEGSSLIIFPEGKRNAGPELLPFKAGLFHLAEARPDIPMVPVWIDNLNRVLPKGEIVPLPFICTVRFGPPVSRVPGESKVEFLKRAEEAVLALRPEKGASLE